MTPQWDYENVLPADKTMGKKATKVLSISNVLALPTC